MSWDSFASVAGLSSGWVGRNETTPSREAASSGFEAGTGTAQNLRKSDSDFYNCGQDDHNKVDYPNPKIAREFTGSCRLCDQQGHRATDCPEKEPKLCRNCEQEGHEAFSCKNPRKLKRDDVKDVRGEDAWELIKVAIQEHDLDDVKEAVAMYVKALPDTTYQQLERAFRKFNMGLYLIALEKELISDSAYTNMDRQGNLHKTYTISWRWSPRPMRPKEIQFWPTSLEENFERLADAGEPVDRGIPKCKNCNQLGHTRKACPKEAIEAIARVEVKCYNCEEIGHRIRDCPNPRPRKLAARGSEVKCHNCGEEGHRKTDCPNVTILICRNCDAKGHLGKDCPLPRDYSRVKCQICEQMGHTKVRCTGTLKEVDNESNRGDLSGITVGPNAEIVDSFGITNELPDIGRQQLWEPGPLTQDGW